MHPIFLKLGPLTIYWYGIFMALAFLAGFANWIWVARRDGRDAQFCSDLLFWVMVAGILGGRAAYLISNFGYYLDHPGEIVALWKGGLIYYGGFVGAIIAVLLFARHRRIPFLSLLDFAFTSLPLSHALGRVGCVMYGCCFGAVAHGWPGIVFPHGSLAWERQIQLGLITANAACSLPVYPVQIYEALWNLALYPIILFAYRRRHQPGAVTGLYLLLYPIGRFLLEGLRGTERLYVGPLSVAQTISVALMAVGALLLLRGRRARAPNSDTQSASPV
ncbi:MAG: prolipoprotein diacylglyceryl transferase [Lentisphaerae bacterium]|nr:prolipoprotein diacylglyceryl transferase [Lentisphaerota bacterium]